MIVHICACSQPIRTAKRLHALCSHAATIAQRIHIKALQCTASADRLVMQTAMLCLASSCMANAKSVRLSAAVLDSACSAVPPFLIMETYLQTCTRQKSNGSHSKVLSFDEILDMLLAVLQTGAMLSHLLCCHQSAFGLTL